MNNYAFIDWQNLNLGVRWESWVIDYEKFRIYLKDKYKVKKAYYFIWYVQDENNKLYTMLQEAWFIVVFKKQLLNMTTSKKWNIDSDLIFYVMEKLIEEPNKFDKIVIVSWDGDFKILVDYLMKKDRLLKVLFPNKKFASSLYKDLTNKYFDYMIHLKTKIWFKKID